MQALAVNELKDRFFCQVNSTLVEVATLNTTSWLAHIPLPVQSVGYPKSIIVFSTSIVEHLPLKGRVTSQ